LLQLALEVVPQLDALRHYLREPEPLGVLKLRDCPCESREHGRLARRARRDTSYVEHDRLSPPAANMDAHPPSESGAQAAQGDHGAEVWRRLGLDCDGAHVALDPRRERVDGKRLGWPRPKWSRFVPGLALGDRRIRAPVHGHASGDLPLEPACAFFADQVANVPQLRAHTVPPAQTRTKGQRSPNALSIARENLSPASPSSTATSTRTPEGTRSASPAAQWPEPGRAHTGR
jgi:hypothetical protein